MIRGGAFAAALLACAAHAEAEGALYASDGDNANPMPGGLSLQAVGTEQAVYDTNPLLAPTGARTLWGSITAPELIVGDKTPLASITSDTIVDSNNFNLSDFDSTDIHSKLAMAEHTQRWGAGFLGAVDYDTTRTSEWSNYNNGLLTPVRHFGGTVAPDLSYKFLPTDKLDLTGAYMASQYDNSAFTNYSVLSAAPSYSHSFDPLNTGVFTIIAQRYSALSGPSNTVDTIGPSIGWRSTLTPQLNGEAFIGFQETRQQSAFFPGTSWTPQYAFYGKLNYKDESNHLTLTASRSEYPFGNGTEALLTQFAVTETHDINQSFSLGAGGSYQFAEYQTSAAGSVHDLAAGTANAAYHLSKHVDLVASYQYQYETLIGLSNRVRDNRVLISIAFHPEAWTL